LGNWKHKSCMNNQSHNQTNFAAPTEKQNGTKNFRYQLQVAIRREKE